MAASAMASTNYVNLKINNKNAGRYMKEFREGKTGTGKQMNLDQLKDLGAALAEHANGMTRQAFKTQRLVEIQNILNAATGQDTLERQIGIENSCAEQEHLIGKIEESQETTRRLLEELKSEQARQREHVSDAVHATSSNIEGQASMGSLTVKAAENSVRASKREAKELSTMQEENEQQRKKICTLHAERDESELLAICQMTDVLEEKADIAQALETQCMKLNDAEAGRQVVQEKLRDTEEQLAKKNDIIAVHFANDSEYHNTTASSWGGLQDCTFSEQSLCNHFGKLIHCGSVVQQ